METKQQRVFHQPASHKEDRGVIFALEEPVMCNLSLGTCIVSGTLQVLGVSGF